MHGDRPSLGQEIAWRLEAAGFALLIAVLRAMGVERASVFGGWLLRTLGPKTGTQRTVLRNLRIAFPDMTEAYDRSLRALAKEAGRDVGLTLREGVYAASPGPQYETPAEVRMLRSRLPAGVPVGTVDRFQGQQAPVVLVSMASSSPDDAPRGIGFAFDRHRFNVATSRAQCRAVLVCSPRLLDADCRTVAQMRLVSAVCRFVELASLCS